MSSHTFPALCGVAELYTRLNSARKGLQRESQHSLTFMTNIIAIIQLIACCMYVTLLVIKLISHTSVQYTFVMSTEFTDAQIIEEAVK